MKTRLIESGWKDEMIFHAKTIVKERGVNNITVHDLVKEITPKGRCKYFVRFTFIIFIFIILFLKNCNF